MQQRQLRLGDILDDYCPRERRLTNHAVVAMIDEDVKRTRCTTCDAEHEYKHARVPRQRRKPAAPAALYSQVLAGAPKRVTHEPAETGVPEATDGTFSPREDAAAGAQMPVELAADAQPDVHASGVFDDGHGPDGPGGPGEHDESEEREESIEEGPVHRPLIRATLPRPEGQPPSSRPGPDFTIRQPGGRVNRFRPRDQRESRPFQANRPDGDMGRPMRGGARQHAGRPPAMSHLARRQGHGRKRSK